MCIRFFVLSADLSFSSKIYMTVQGGYSFDPSGLSTSQVEVPYSITECSFGTTTFPVHG